MVIKIRSQIVFLYVYKTFIYLLVYNRTINKFLARAIIGFLEGA